MAWFGRPKVNEPTVYTIDTTTHTIPGITHGTAMDEMLAASQRQHNAQMQQWLTGAALAAQGTFNTNTAQLQMQAKADYQRRLLDKSAYLMGLALQQKDPLEPDELSAKCRKYAKSLMALFGDTEPT